MEKSRIIRRDAASTITGLTEHPLLDRILSVRGVRNADELAFSLKHLPSPGSLSGMSEAVDLLVNCLQAQKRLLIVGDYDADGATSTAVLYRALVSMGAQHVDYLLPNRFEFGYGLSEEIVELAQERQPDLIITVDNGIASIAGVVLAKHYKLKVLITDHHLPPETLPEADAIVNPNLSEDNSGCENLAGVGVIFFVMLALRARLTSCGWFEKNKLAIPNLASLLDLVAIGTVADVVKLDAINRTLVEQGLRRIRANATRPGVRALLQVAGKTRESVCSNDIGFALGPRLNAAGRLSDMTIGVECLLSDSEETALALANRLDELNKERRAIESSMHEEAGIILRETANALCDSTLDAMCLYEPHWHQGVVGILASRIKDTINRPVIVFAADEQGTLKGSGRSIAGVHLRDVIDAVASAHPGLISKFGGHAMAAGLSLAETNFAQFSAAFTKEVAAQLRGLPLHKQWLSDGELPTELLQLAWAERLRFLVPWGQGFSEPLFDDEFDIVHARIVGTRHLKLRVQKPGDAFPLDAIAFNQAPEQLPQGRWRLVYKLDINEYRGERSLQLLVEHLQASE